MGHGRSLRVTFGLAAGFALAAGVAAAGCASPGPRAFDASLDVRPDAVFEIGEVTSQADASPKIDQVALLRRALEDAARERGILWTGDAAQDRYVLSTRIVEYAPGNAFMRWIAPGSGATILHVAGELVDPRDGSVAGRVDHQRSVWVGGAYTIGAWQTIFDSLADDVMTDLDRRSKRTGFTVVLAPWSSQQDVEIPPTDAPRTIRVGAIDDRREERGRIGTREAAFGVSMGDVFASRDVPGYLAEVVGDDLRAQGHRVVDDGPADELSAVVTRFWLHTDTTPLYWDVVADVELRVEVASPTPERAVPETTLACQAEARTYVYPSAKLMQRVVTDCLGDLLASLRQAMEPGASE